MSKKPKPSQAPSAEIPSAVPTEEETKRLLGEIYNADETDLTQMSRRSIKRPGSPRRRRLIIATAAVIILAATAIAGFLVFTQRDTTAKELSVELTGPEAVASGESVVLTVTLHNTDNIPSTETLVQFQYPTQFQATSASWAATDESRTTFSIGSILSGEEKTLTVTGVLTGSIGDTAAFSLVARYQPSNFSSPFEVRRSLAITLTSSVLELSLAGPTTVVVGQTLTYTAELTNTSVGPLDDVGLELTLPAGFVLSSSEPGFDDRRWQPNGPFPNGAKQAFTFKGSFPERQGDTGELRLEAYLEPAGSSRQVQQSASLVLFVVEPQASLSLLVDNTTVVNSDVDKSIEAAIRLRNLGEATLHEVELVVTLTSKHDDGEFTAALYDRDSVSGSDGGQFDGQRIRWTSADWPALASLKPGADLRTSFRLQTVNELSGDVTETTHPRIAMQAKLSTKKIEQSSSEAIVYEIASSTVDVRLAAPSSVSSTARYYDEDFVALGSGPLPPVVGQATTYRIIWSIATTANELNGVVLTGHLSDRAVWTGQSQVAAGEPLAYDPATRTVTWKINTVPAHRTDTSVNAWFDVTITPLTADVGFVLDLVEAIELQGQDGYTGKNAYQRLPPLTTELDADVKGRGQGQVKAST